MKNDAYLLKLIHSAVMKKIQYNGNRVLSLTTTIHWIIYSSNTSHRRWRNICQYQLLLWTYLPKHNKNTHGCLAWDCVYATAYVQWDGYGLWLSVHQHQPCQKCLTCLKQTKPIGEPKALIDGISNGGLWLAGSCIDTMKTSTKLLPTILS